jgi:hypothetical protein
MLLALSMILGYENKKQVKFYPFLLTLAFNFAMLLFGYLGEIQQLSTYLSTFLGFIPFILMFYIIYINYAIFTEDGMKIFFYFSIVWAFYGVAALLPYHLKNSLYNILDLLAKNFFGTYLALTLLYELRNP